MELSKKTLEIQTLGCFNISVDGNSVATVWPDEISKVVFCSLLAPLDLYISWDRICRSIWDAPVTRSSRRRLEETILRPLNSFLIRELGFNPLIYENDGIKFDHKGIHLDALEFHRAVVEGLGLFSQGNFPAAIEKISRANALYAGCYLPDMPGKIIASTRKDLDSLFRNAVMVALPNYQASDYSVIKRKQKPALIAHKGRIKHFPIHI